MRDMGMILRKIPNYLQETILFDAHCSRDNFKGDIGCVEEFLSRGRIDTFWTGTEIAEEESVVGVSLRINFDG